MLLSPPASEAKARVIPLIIVCGPRVNEFRREIETRRPTLGLIVISTADSDNRTAEELSDRITQVASEGTAQVILIACQAETNLSELVVALSENEKAGRLTSNLRLSSVAMAIDAGTIVETLVHQKTGGQSSLASSLAEQIEAVSMVLLDATGARPEVAGLAAAVITALNPHAAISPMGDHSVPAKLCEDSEFVFDAGITEAHWRSLMEDDAQLAAGHGISAVNYRARRPFQPERFREFLKGQLQGVIRAKGFFWLATQMDIVAGLNVAGAEKQAAPVGQWWAAMAQGRALGSDCPEPIRKEWMEPFGDRRQSLAFIGVHLDGARLRAGLDACLLTAAEMEAGPETWRAYPDPFPIWSQPAHQHQDHHHDCGCHH